MDVCCSASRFMDLGVRVCVLCLQRFVVVYGFGVRVCVFGLRVRCVRVCVFGMDWLITLELAIRLETGVVYLVYVDSIMSV